MAAPMGGVLQVARTAGTPIPDAMRASLIRALRAGEYVPPLLADIVAYRQDAEPNLNFVRFTDEALVRLVGSFVDRPLLHDHDQLDARNVGGRVVACSLANEGGAMVIRQTVEAVKPWAQEGLLDGTIKTFSIGWRSVDTREPYCSLDGASMFSLDCIHMPGQRVETKDGVRIVEMIYDDVKALEVSAAAVPAVAEAMLEEVRATLSAWRAEKDPEAAAQLVRLALAKEKVMTKFPILIAVLGLSADAGEEVVVESVRKLKSEHATELAAHSQTKNALASAQARLDEVEAREKAAKLEALIDGLYRDGKIAGEKGNNDVEKSIRDLYALSVVGAEAFAKSMPRLVPVGGAGALGEERTGRKPGVGRLSETQRAINKQLRISDEEYLKRNPIEGQ
jgi:phage head maturation protease